MRYTLALTLALALVACRRKNDTDAIDLDADDDGVEDAADCGPTDPAIFPGNAEVPYNDVDDDCDPATLDDDLDGDGHTSRVDCDDDDAAVHPGAVEACNGIDDDCSGVTDDAAGERWYADEDGDGYGDPLTTEQSCDGSGGFVADDSDCDDKEATIHPTADERCDGVDQNCDGDIDELATDGTTFYGDGDGDGHGTADVTIVACDAPEGFVASADDCDDEEVDAHPGSTEVCDDVDNDCDGTTDEADATGAVDWYLDGDGDGWGDAATRACEAPADHVARDGDCDDQDALVKPGGVEVCNGEDDDCDGTPDDDAVDEDTFFIDVDKDGQGAVDYTTTACAVPVGYVANDDDCDDLDVAVFRGASETCNDTDDDCDGAVDEGATDETTWYADGDKDTFGSAAVFIEACDAPAGFVASSDDCNDASANARPGGAEVCDALDNDCNGTADVGASDAKTWYTDADTDGYGVTASTTLACSVPSGYAAVGGDCNDAANKVHPAAVETCDNVDQDCDGTKDDSAVDAKTWYADGDGDTFGRSTTTTVACAAPTGFVASSTDCNDAVATVFPGAVEVCDNVDQDCDGAKDDNAVDATVFYADADGDKYGSPTNTTKACSQPVGYLTDKRDCHDTISTAFPGSHAVETPLDGIDQDCDGLDVCTDNTCDGYPDFVVGSHHDGDYNTTSGLYAGSANGYLTGAWWGTQTDGPLGVVSDDFDGDGYLDVAYAEYNSASSSVYYGSSAGYSTADRVDLGGTHSGTYDACSGDFDDDGRRDLVIVNYGGATAVDSYVYWGSAAGLSTADRSAMPSSGATSCVTADVDQDGYDDVVLTGYHLSGSYATTAWIYFGSAAGVSVTDRVGLASVGAYQDPIVVDLDDDGYNEIVFPSHHNGTSYVTSTNYVYWGSASGWSASDRTALTVSGPWGGAKAADFNGDGRLDLVFPAYYDTDYVTTSPVFLQTATNTFTASSVINLPTQGTLGVAVGHLNADVYPDVVFANYHNGTYDLNSRIYWGTAAGPSPTTFTDLPTEGPTRVRIVDADDDGDNDVLFVGYYAQSGGYTGAESFLYFNTNGTFTSGSVARVPTTGSWDAAIYGTDPVTGGPPLP